MNVKRGIARAAGYALGAIPLSPKDREIRIPGTGYSVINRTAGWGKKHKTLYKIFNAAAASSLLLSPLIADTVVNTASLYATGQHKVQHPVNAPRYAGIDERAAKNGELTLAVYNVSFGAARGLAQNLKEHPELDTPAYAEVYMRQITQKS